jgi:hypothetical protein
VATRKLDKTEWQRFFDRTSGALVGKRAEIELASLALGNQIEAEWLPLLGITFDPKSDILEIALTGIDHMIPHPEQISVVMDGLRLTSLEVVDRDGLAQIVRLRDPLMLPSPTGAAR